jgi:hypothetical protein
MGLFGKRYSYSQGVRGEGENVERYKDMLDTANQRIAQLEDRLQEWKDKHAADEVEKQLAEIREFISEGDEFWHAGLKYVCTGISANNYNQVSIRAQVYSKEVVGERFEFSYERLPCLKKQNKEKHATPSNQKKH